jgi:DNA gyrase inhibitor GyrI
MASPEVRFTIAPKIVAAVLERRGSYSSIGDSMRDLKNWVDSKGMAQAGYPFCLFYDNPTETRESDLRSAACVPLANAFETQGRYKVKRFPETEVAETRHRGAPEQFASTYGPFLEGLLRKGYQLEGPAREFFKTFSGVKGPGSGFLIQQPIRRK